jgi:hypothetical protein
VTRRAAPGLLLLAALISLLALSGPASAAAKPCGRQVLDDWNDGRIDGTYALHCYDDAIELIPRDVRYYSSAEEDINRALQAAMRGQRPPPNSGGVPVAPPEDPAETDTTATGGQSTPRPPDGPGPEVTPPLVGSESVSSVPIPLLILAGLALLLIAGGSAGYLLRRVQSRRLPPPPAV